jgi:hypothetical protein
VFRTSVHPRICGFRREAHARCATASDLILEYRFANGDVGRFPGLVAELIKLPVDVIVTWGTPAALAAIKATSSVPIVMSAGDPVGAGLVASLARPGANVTGFSSQTAGREEKRLELLKELLPNLSRVVVLSNSTNPYSVVAPKRHPTIASTPSRPAGPIKLTLVQPSVEPPAKLQRIPRLVAYTRSAMGKDGPLFPKYHSSYSIEMSLPV